MSRIYFTTQHEGTVEIRGSERAHMGIVVADVACAMLPHDADIIRARFTQQGYEHFNYPGRAEHHFRQDLRLMLQIGDNPIFQRDGKELANFSLLLNTVLALGSDPLCLFIRLHAQCEIHAYVEGPHRAWMADIIEQGLASGLYRTHPDPLLNAGWPGLVALLRNTDNAPVVTSYSITGGFPNAFVAAGLHVDHDDWTDEDGEIDEDSWDELSDDEQWTRCLAALRADTESLREINPDTLRGRFRHELSLIDLFA